MPRRCKGHVEIGGQAACAVGSGVEGSREKAVHVGEFGGLVDDAARGAAAEIGGIGTLNDFDFFQVEGVAVVAAEVAHAIDVEIVAGAEAADRQVVALRAAFAGGNADTGDIAEARRAEW